LFRWGFGVSLLFLIQVNLAFAYEHPRYNIKATIDTVKKTVAATQEVQFTNNGEQPVSEIYFHIYPNRHYTKEEKNFMLRYAGYFKINPFPDGFQSGRMNIQEVREDGHPLEFAIEGDDKTILKVNLPASLPPGHKTTVALHFSVDIPHAYGRFGWHENIMALSRWYPILSVQTKEGWANYPFYPFHRPFFSDGAYYSVALEVPGNQVVIHSGNLKTQSQEGAKKVFQIESSSPLREFTLALSPDYQVVSEDFGAVKINSFYFKGDEERARLALQSARDMMQYYTELFGDYPYEEFSIAPVYLGYGGEQMANMTFIDTRVYQLPKFLKRYLDFLIAHETGHQWLFNMVGVNEYSEIWLEEGVHSHFLLEHLEQKYGQNAPVVELPAALDWLVPNFSFRRARDMRYQLIARNRVLDHPIVDKLSSFHEPSSIFSLTYGKGAYVTAMLREIMGPEAFLKTFKRIFQEYQFQNLSLADFQKICEQESGQDLKGFFDQWLYTTKRLDYAVAGVRGNKVILQNRQEVAMPLEVEARFADGRSEKIVWDGQQKSQEVEFKSASKIKRVRIDPAGQWLDIDKTNNTWPRPIHVKPVPLYLGLYDIPIFLPEDSYNIVFGPELANSGIGAKASVQKPYDQSVYVAGDYVLGEDLFKSRAGYELKNVFNSLSTLGVEIFNTEDLEDGEEDLAGGKVYLRKELWPAPYNLTAINDHVTLYMIRNRSLNPTPVTGLEDSRNVSYLKHDEAIVGMAFHFDRSRPALEPSGGYKVDTFFESSGHFLEATQYFNRGAVDLGFYRGVTPRTNLAWRLKYGGGFPNDKNFFELGGIDGLRGYDRKTLRGANLLLSSLEYRFPLLEKIDVSAFDHILTLESLGAVVFFDGGHSWRAAFDDSQFKKDAGLGVRFTVSLGSFLEKVLVRADVAQAIHEPKEDTHFWFGVGHSF